MKMKKEADHQVMMSNPNEQGIPYDSKDMTMILTIMALFNEQQMNDITIVGEWVTNNDVEIRDQSLMKDRRVTFEPKSQLPAKVRFAVDVEHTQDQLQSQPNRIDVRQSK